MEVIMSLLDRIKEAGIVGAGGAGFPTHAKLSSKSCKPSLATRRLLGSRRYSLALRVSYSVFDVLKRIFFSINFCLTI
jgi:hypothetical protein